MHKLLTRFLIKRGIKDPTELDNSPTTDGSPTERETFETYRNILDKKELTVEDIKLFCKGQIGAIEARWRDYDRRKDTKEELIPYHTAFKLILGAIEGAKVERETLEKRLESLIK